MLKKILTGMAGLHLYCIDSIVSLGTQIKTPNEDLVL